MTSDDLPHQVQAGWPMDGESARADAPHWQPWKLYGVKLQKHSGLDGKDKSVAGVVSVGSQVPILMAIDGR
jgi:hypothetical protein